MTPDGNSNEHRKNKEHWYKYVITKKKKVVEMNIFSYYWFF